MALVPENEADILNKAFICLQNFINYMQYLSSAPKVGDHQKKKFCDYLRRGNWVMQDFIFSIDKESAEAFKKETANWEAMGFENIFTEAQLLSLPDRQSLELIVIAMRKGEFKIEYSADAES